MMTEQQLPLNIEGIEQYQSKLDAASGVWLNAFRKKSFDLWVEVGMPTVKDEEWKYLSLADVVNRRFQLATRHTLIEDRQFENYRDKNDINIVLVNGVLWGELSDLKHLPQGLVVSTLNEALAHHNAEVQDTISKLIPNDSKAFLSMNQALFLDGVL